MKKLLIVLLAAFVFVVVNPTKSEAKVMYDGAEVVKGQTGKMTFKKDIKVYKKNPNGTFDSLMVKRNKFFRTYDIEKYDGKIFYQMGEYRVQATDLVVFKEVPIKIRSSFYNNPTYIFINRDSTTEDYGWNFRKKDSWYISFVERKTEQMLAHCDSINDGTYDPCYYYSGTDLKIAETILRESDVRYELINDSAGKPYPLKESKTEKIVKKGTIVFSMGTETNGYLQVHNGLKGHDIEYTWLPVNSLKLVKNK
ncbi:hypothetical protein [Lysinibacillus sp. Bpr_S20]|uniref:hypothetical protein n=1 Tax=Lysinibacillus sp. Bpr_S20 TaxID=2933964 RepID=UPI002012C7A4|nr:hypothetical protein [Lysinibacillus sp. Bpr_S20]MCL1701400.1 hypothetical protein [Lysinibacillus sp. Bpr_S20]